MFPLFFLNRRQLPVRLTSAAAAAAQRPAQGSQRDRCRRRPWSDVVFRTQPGRCSRSPWSCASCSPVASTSAAAVASVWQPHPLPKSPPPPPPPPSAQSCLQVQWQSACRSGMDTRRPPSGSASSWS